MMKFVSVFAVSIVMVSAATASCFFKELAPQSGRHLLRRTMPTAPASAAFWQTRGFMATPMLQDAPLTLPHTQRCQSFLSQPLFS